MGPGHMWQWHVHAAKFAIDVGNYLSHKCHHL